jgi:DNA-directed RNA polymerase specialized sigma24 family protein
MILSAGAESAKMTLARPDETRGGANKKSPFGVYPHEEDHDAMIGVMHAMAMDAQEQARSCLDAFIGGDTEAFGEVVGEYNGRLLAYARAFLDNPEDCREVVQDAFLKFHQSRAAIHGNAQAWLFKVTRNLCIDIRRRQARQKADPGNMLPFPGSLHPDDRLKVREALAGLPERDRTIVCLKVLQGLSYQEIGDALGITASNVGFILHHGLKKLASILSPGGQP